MLGFSSIGQDQYETNYVEGIAGLPALRSFDEHVRSIPVLFGMLVIMVISFSTYPRPLHAGSTGRRNLPVNVASGEIWLPVVDQLFLTNC